MPLLAERQKEPPRHPLRMEAPPELQRALTSLVDAQRAYVESFHRYSRAPGGDRTAELARAEQRLDARWDALVKARLSDPASSSDAQ